MEIKKNEKKPELNVWLIVSIVLAIALVSVLATTLKPGLFGGDNDNSDDFVVISKEDASNKLLGFITEVYGAQIGTPTVKEVNEKYGMYEVKMGLVADGQPRDEVTFVTKDGKLFVPNVLIMDESLQQFRDWQTQQQQIQAEVPTDGQAIDTNAALELPAEPETPTEE